MCSDSSTPGDVAAVPVSPHLDTAKRLGASAKVIRGWLSACLQDHATGFCADEFPGHFLRGPKRLIQLDPIAFTFQLVDTSGLHSMPPYVALSYVWGTKGNYVTEKNTLARLKSPIPLADLPKTIREACEVTILIGLRHIWVDALCIVQNDDDEKVTEIANMAAVYWNAWLQIAAMRSRGATDGLLQPLDTPVLTHDQIKDHHLIMKACRSLKQDRWDGQLREYYPLLTRGWTFQERILARRCVHFTCHGLVWECKLERWFEYPPETADAGGNQATDTAINNLSGAFLRCIMLAHANPHEAALARTIPMWREFVTSYSKRYLTDMDDRLLAISGIARMIRSEQWGEGYAAGLWRDAMPFDLLWRCDRSSSDRLHEKKERKPSWSWSSVDCGVNWPAVAGPGSGAKDGETGPRDPLEYVGRGTYFEQGLERVEVRRINVDAPTGVFGRIHAGLIELKARSVPVRIRRQENLNDTEWAIEGTDKSTGVLPYYPDLKASDADPFPGEYLFVEVVSHQVGQQRWEAGLVVTAAEGRDAYERIGMAGRSRVDLEHCPGGWFQGADHRIIRVV